MSDAKQGYLPTLDGWRAIAIVAVLLDHTIVSHFAHSNTRLVTLTRIGPNGVSLFFAISGFLICSRLIEEETLTGKISLGGFYLRRACRILPAALTYLVVIGVLGLTGLIAVGQWDWWSSVLFFRNYLPPNLIYPGWGGYTVHYWSLAVEEHFYLLWPAFLALVGRRRAIYWGSGAAIAISVWRWWDFHHHWMDRHIPGLIFGTRTDVRLDGLLMGCMAALLVTKPAWRKKAVVILGTWSCWGLIAVYAAFQFPAHSHRYTIWESALLPAIVLSTVLHPESWLGRVLELPLARWIGRLSYSLYLWQQLFSLNDAKRPVSLLQYLPLSVVLLFLVAFASYKFIERPMIRFGHKLAPPPTPGRKDVEVAPGASRPAIAPVADGTAAVTGSTHS